MTRKKILLDMDGVIADFIGGAARIHGKDASTVATWDFLEEWEIAPKDFWSPLGRDFWANLNPTDEAFGIVKMCECAVGPENVCLLSSPCLTDGCMEGKLDWIRRHFPQYSRRYLFGPKKEFCSSADRLLIDDSDANCASFRHAGGQAFLFPRPWNESRKCACPLAMLSVFL